MLALREKLRLAPVGDDRLRFLGEAGYLWLYLGELDQAEIVFKGLAALAPDDPVGLLGLAEAALRRGEFRDAERHIDRALLARQIEKRTMALAHVIRGRVLLGRNKPREACRAWDSATKLDPAAPEAVLAAQWRRVAEATLADLDTATRPNA